MDSTTLVFSVIRRCIRTLAISILVQLPVTYQPNDLTYEEVLYGYEPKLPGRQAMFMTKPSVHEMQGRPLG